VSGVLPPFQDVVDRHGADVRRFCVATAGPARADDVYQETMLSALAAYPRLRDAAAVRSWLLTIASRKATDSFRSAARAVPVADPDLGGRDDAPPPDGALWAAVRALPGKQRLAVAYRFVLDLPYAEIAAAMGTSEEAARRSVHEGLKRLRGDARAAGDPVSLARSG
jgi:DNA-directed RNA polymerase specialized sigma24 family protein